MATFRPRKKEETLDAYLKAKQAFDIKTTGKTGITLPTQKPITPTTPVTPTAKVLGKKIEGFPKSSNEHDIWLKQGRTWDSATGSWYEKGTTAPTSTPTPTTAKPTLESIEKGIAGVAEKTKALQERVKEEGITPTPLIEPETLPKDAAPTTGLTIDDINKWWSESIQPTLGAGETKAPEAKAPEATTQAFIQTQNEALLKQFETMQTTQLKAREDLEKQQQDFLKQFGTQATEQIMSQFKEMQEQQKQAQQEYYQQQQDFLKQMQEQPSSVERLQKYREEQGLPQMEKMLAKNDQVILDTERLLANLEEDIKARTEGLPVSEAARRRIEAMEGAPLEKRLQEQLRARQEVAIGLEQKERTVQEFMAAEQEDIQRKLQAGQVGLGFAQEKAAFETKMSEQGFGMFQDLQNRALEISKVGLGFAETGAEFRSNLATQGFSVFSEFQARDLTGFTADLQTELNRLQRQEALDEGERNRMFELQQAGEKFKQQLVLIQFETDLKKANPEIANIESVLDDQGNLTMITTLADGSKTSQAFPGVGKVTPEEKESDLLR